MTAGECALDVPSGASASLVEGTSRTCCDSSLRVPPDSAVRTAAQHEPVEEQVAADQAAAQCNTHHHHHAAAASTAAVTGLSLAASRCWRAWAVELGILGKMLIHQVQGDCHGCH